MAYTSKLYMIYGDATLGPGGDGSHYIFSYERNGLGSLKLDGKEWLCREPMPVFQRATTDNDRGGGFNIRSTQWLTAGVFHKCVEINLTVDNQHFAELPIAPITSEFNGPVSVGNVKIKYTSETLTIPATQITVTYEVSGRGETKVTMRYYDHKDLPGLSVVGMCFIMPTIATGFDYQGLSSETYPDRMAGTIEGAFHVDGLPVTRYLVPQENETHIGTYALTITRDSVQNNADRSREPFSLAAKQDEQPFTFSCLPYTTEELESTARIEELPLARRTALVITEAVRGVGRIDSWGVDAEEQYHIPAGRDVESSFILDTK